jgi:ABC-2 type transport system ATP-binding protein
MNLIETEKLEKRFGHTDVLKGLDLAVPAGSVFALVGPNGAGKTTTIKTLLNIWRPTAGAARVQGVDSRRLGPAEFARIGHVSENQELPEWMTVGYLMGYLKPFYPKWDDAAAAALVKQFELPVERRLKHLSRGMKMKAALASSLAYQPELIVLDEPFSGLDVLVREELVEALLERCGESTVFISSHDLGDIETFASHIAYLEDGRIRFAEEMAALSARFREVEVTLAGEAVLPGAWPEAWLQPRATAAVVRFVDSAFDVDETPRRVRELFPGAVRQVDVRALPLKDIFVALARRSRSLVA